MSKPKKTETVALAPPLLCATAGCPYDARVRVRRREAQWVKGFPNPVHVAVGAWINLCHSCDDQRIRRENLEYCKLMGLDTPTKQREWCRANMRAILEPKPGPAMREPGQDEGEISA